MSRIIVLYSILSLLSITGYSQEKMNFRYADSITYDLYLKKNWPELIKIANQAIDSGHDYYYMRMRIAIAFYERGNYAGAALHINKALDFNNNDQVALEYLFYAYYFSGRYSQAWSVLHLLPIPERERIVKESRFKKNSITIESFYNDALTDDITGKPDISFPDTEPGTQSVTTSFINNTVYLSHFTGENTSYFHSFTNLIKDNYFHYFDVTGEADMPSQRVIQNQYYGRLSFFGRSGWIVSPSIHIMTAGYPLVWISQTGSPSTYRSRTGGFAGGIGITRTGGYLTTSAEAVYSKLNNTRQVQGSFSLVLYPAGNRNIYLGGSITGIADPWSAGTGNNRLIPGFIAGFGIKERVWLEFTGRTGTMKNYSENIGLVVYNSTDYLTEKYNGKIIIPFYRAGIIFFAGAGKSISSSEFLPLDGVNNNGPNRLDYKNYSITGGISWNF